MTDNLTHEHMAFVQEVCASMKGKWRNSLGTLEWGDVEAWGYEALCVYANEVVAAGGEFSQDELRRRVINHANNELQKYRRRSALPMNEEPVREEMAAQAAAGSRIRDCMEILNDRERFVIDRHFKCGWKIGDIAKELKCSARTVQRIKREALDKMNKEFG